MGNKQKPTSGIFTTLQRHLIYKSVPGCLELDATAIPRKNCYLRGEETIEVGSHGSVIKWVMDILGCSIAYKCARLCDARYII